jgi:hypothetical protein
VREVGRKSEAVKGLVKRVTKSEVCERGREIRKRLVEAKPEAKVGEGGDGRGDGKNHFFPKRKLGFVGKSFDGKTSEVGGEGGERVFEGFAKSEKSDCGRKKIGFLIVAVPKNQMGEGRQDILYCVVKKSAKL